MSRLSPSHTADVLRWTGFAAADLSTDAPLAEAIMRAFPAFGYRIGRASEDFPAIREALRLHPASPSQSCDQSEAA